MLPSENPPTRVQRCPVCADVVGVYESAICVLGNGSAMDGSPLVANRYGEVVAAYHPWCAPPETGRP